MGIDPSRLGKHYRKRLREETIAGKERVDSNLEARFILLLREARIPKWKLHAKIEPMGTGHTADFLWLDVPRRGSRVTRRNLAIFIDGGVHKLKLPEDCRRDNICTLLGVEWSVFRFADNQLELGVQCVKLWHQGDLLGLLTALREWRGP